MFQCGNSETFIHRGFKSGHKSSSQVQHQVAVPCAPLARISSPWERPGVSPCIQYSHYIKEDCREERSDRIRVVFVAVSYTQLQHSLRCCAAVGGMDVRAILLAGVPNDPNEESFAPSPDFEETFAGVRLALIPVLGQAVLHRTRDRLEKSGIDSI